jgi:hypothetical protein
MAAAVNGGIIKPSIVHGERSFIILFMLNFVVNGIYGRTIGEGSSTRFFPTY